MKQLAYCIFVLMILATMGATVQAGNLYERGTAAVNNYDGWSWNTDVMWWDDYNSDGDYDCCFGWTVGTGMWADTGITIEADTVYTASFTVKGCDWDASIDKAELIMQDSSSGWSDIIRTQFPETGEVPIYDWTTYSITLDTSTTEGQAFVGGTMGLGIHLQGAEAGYLYMDEVILVPEPATIAVFALGGAFILRRRRPG